MQEQVRFFQDILFIAIPLPGKLDIGASNGRCYIAAMAGDPGAFQNFNISVATLLSNIYAGDNPPEGTQFVRMISFRATSGSVTIRWTGGTGSVQPYMICALVN